MGVLAALAVRRVHVLVVAPQGWDLLGARVEAAVRRRGWHLVEAPADADALVVCGEVHGAMAEAVDALWRAVPAPRVRRRLRDAAAIAPVLDSAARVLADDRLQREAWPGRVEPLPAAQREATGVRPVVLGPLLPDWPVGLVVTGEVHRGVLLKAEGRLLGAVEPTPADSSSAASSSVGSSQSDSPTAERLTAVEAATIRRCGLAARVLRLAGWPARARQVAAVADAVLRGSDPADVRRRLVRISAGVRRSAVLRWNLAGIGDGIDVRDRLLALLADAATERPLRAPDPTALAEALLGRRIADAPLLLSLAAAVPDA